VEIVTDFIQNCIDGVMIGSGYALLAIGFTIIFGVLRRLNLSYGPSIMLGAFVGTLLYVQFQAHAVAVAMATVVGAVLAGMYVERVCFWAIRRGAAVASMVSSFAIWMQLEELAIVMLPERTYPFPPLTKTAPIEIGPFFLRSEHLTMFVVAVVLVAAVHTVLYRTRFGLAVRAVSENRLAARFMGINVDAVMFWAFALVSAIGGVAGFLILATDQQVTPYFGLWATFKGLIAMMLGGMGSLPGAILGGLILGIVEVQSLWYLGNDYKDLSAYFLLFLVLIIRPGGILGHALSERERAAFRRV
jgi:branched-subunit amino acid ABC-type transport system permease component